MFGVWCKKIANQGGCLLVVKQVLGVWQTKNTSLKNMCFRIKGFATQVGCMEYQAY